MLYSYIYGSMVVDDGGIGLICQLRILGHVAEWLACPVCYGKSCPAVLQTLNYFDKLFGEPCIISSMRGSPWQNK